MTAYLPGVGRRVYKVRLEVAPGVWVARSTGTRDPRQAARIHQMCRDLGSRGARAWDLLSRVHATDWSLADLYEKYRMHRGELDAIRGEMDDVMLSALHEPFLRYVARDASPDTAQHYKVYLDNLERHGITRRSDLTVPRLSEWMDRMHGSAATRRKYAAGVSSFCAWLVRRAVLTANPMRDVKKPALSSARVSFVETADAIRIADAQPGKFRLLSALLAGTGLDLSVALGLRRDQVDLETWGIVSRRTKTGRSHVVLVAQWARPYVRELCEGVFPATPLFEGITRFQARKVHHEACKSLGLHGYWMRDARHTWAVRFARAGGTPAQAAEQLGHADGGVLFLKVYGRYVPTLAERAAVEARADRRDKTG